jgi:hypothetical protein
MIIVLRDMFGSASEIAIARALPDVPTLWLHILVLPLVFGGGAGLVFGVVIRWGTRYELSPEP